MKVIVVTSGKGGVGKDFVLNGLANELDSHIIIELDYSTSNLEDSDEVINPPKGFTTKSSIKLYIRRAMKIAVKRDVEYVLINTPPTLSDVMTAIVEELDTFNLLYVTTPSQGAIQDTLRGINYYKLNGKSNVIGVVQNMVGDDFGNEFDSLEVLDVSTVMTFKLSDEDADDKFAVLAKKVSNMSLETIAIKPMEDSMAKIDDEYINSLFGDFDSLRQNKSLLRYFNADTWDKVKELLEDTMYNGILPNHLSDPILKTPAESCKSIEDVDTFWIMLRDIPSVEGCPKTPFVLHRVKKVQNQKFKYVPQAMLSNGVVLWLHECMVYTDEQLSNMPEYKPYSEDIMRTDYETWKDIVNAFIRHGWSEDDLVKLYNSIGE